MKTTQKILKPLLHRVLSPPEANALMVMIENEIETLFDDFDPIADWEFADLYAYKLSAYKKYKEWYLDTHKEEYEEENG
jgi:hypothetical protein|tara:strand:+ start:1589 stop:1825 length:237 start_codon:yes stop_codon:yes gene_type:complete